LLEKSLERKGEQRTAANAIGLHQERCHNGRPTMRRAMFKWCITGCITLVCQLHGALAEPVAYSVTDLGPLTDGAATGINERGDIVGDSFAVRAYRRPAHGHITALSPLPGGSFNRVTGINALGNAVGHSETATHTVHAVLYSAEGRTTDLGTFARGLNSYATGINRAGDIVGFADIGEPGDTVNHAFLLPAGGRMTDLGILAGGASSSASGINNRGDVVGYADTVDSSSHAFIYPVGGRMTDLGTLPGGSSSRATAINARGDVVGFSRNAAGQNRAFLYPASGHMTDLGTLTGCADSEAWSINVRGDVVGDCIMADGTSRAFLYHNSNMKDLNDLLSTRSGLVLVRANAISDTGQIVGVAQVNGIAHAVLLIPAGN